MSESSAIEWCDATWQILSGCRPKNTACRICYSANLCGTRLKHLPDTKGLVRRSADGRFVFNGEVRFNERRLDWPLRWRGDWNARAERRPSRIFVADRSDIGYETVKDEWRDAIFAIQYRAFRHTFINLTKRPATLAAYLQTPARMRAMTRAEYVRLGHDLSERSDLCAELRRDVYDTPALAASNMWIGWSAHDQESFDEGWAALKPLAQAGWLVWVSIEPMLGPVDVRKALAEGLRWVVVGGESGKGARPMHPDWVREIEWACAFAGVAFFFKQWGAWVPESHLSRATLAKLKPRHFHGWTDLPAGTVDLHSWRLSKKKAGALLDGKLHRQWPEQRVASGAAGARL